MYLTFELAKNDLKKKVSGSYLGWFWLLVKPMLTIIVMWGVFSYGFKTPPVDGVDFILWISCGFVIWIYFSDSLNDITHSFLEYGYLVKQSQVKAITIIRFKLLSSMLSSSMIFLLLYFIYVVTIDVYSIKSLLIVYYYFCTFCLLYSLGLLLSSLRVFLKDVSDALGASLQVLFWFTPIIWNLSLIPSNAIWFFKINPLVYIIEGTRELLMNDNILGSASDTITFWFSIALIYACARYVYDRISGNFCDVL